MPVSVADSKQLVRAWLLDDPTLAAAVDGRVFGAHLSSSDAQTVLRDKSIVVFDFVGGAGRYFREFESVTADLYVYSKASADAAAVVYDLVYLRLQAERIKVTGIGPCGSGTERSRPVGGRNEELAAWFLRSRWSFSFIAGPE